MQLPAKDTPYPYWADGASIQLSVVQQRSTHSVRASWESLSCSHLSGGHPPAARRLS